MFSQKVVSTEHALLLFTSLLLVSLIITRINAVNNALARYRTNDTFILRVIPPFDSTVSITGTHIKYGLLDIYSPDVVQARWNEGIIMSCESGNNKRNMTDIHNDQIRSTCQVKEYFMPTYSSGKYSIVYVYSKLRYFKAKMANFSSKYFPEPHATLFFGILFGNNTQFSPKFHDALIKSGVSHVVSASGYNVTWVVTLITLSLQRFLPKKITLICVLVGISIYALVSGLSPPILRASVMGCISVFSRILKRKMHIFKLILLTVLILLVINPYMFYNIGFQLSILSTLSIIYIYPFLRKYIHSSQVNTGYIKETVLITISVFLSTTPLIASTFGRISTISFVTNVLLLWIVPIVMVLGMFFLLFCIISRYIAVIIAFILWVFLEFFVRVVYFSSSVVFSSIEVPKISLHIVVIWQVLLFGVIFGTSKLKNYYK